MAELCRTSDRNRLREEVIWDFYCVHPFDI